MKGRKTALDWSRGPTEEIPACRNDNDIAGRTTGTSVLPAKAICLAKNSAISFSRLPDRRPLAVRNDSSVASQALPCPPLPWRDALLAGGERELLPERMLYFVLTATTVASLVLAFLQLRSLEAGWASFVGLVGRIGSWCDPSV